MYDREIDRKAFMKQILAAFIFFTRLPFWRIATVQNRYYARVVAYWPLTGWLTAAVMAGTMYGAAFLWPVQVAVALAMVVRVLLTGALHEDGLSDFLDGFGGGASPKQTLDIMKDSRTGSYGIIGLILYFLLQFAVFSSLPIMVSCAVVLCADPFCKFAAATTINFLPYARTSEQSKSGVVYQAMRPFELVLAAVTGILPMLLFASSEYWIAALAPLLCSWLLVRWMKRRIGGYTGDCCGASFLICEGVFYLAFSALYWLG